MAAYRLITFDIYAALFDIAGSLTPVLARAIGRSTDDAAPLFALWRAKQMERAAASNSLGKGHISFRDATRLGLDYVLARHGPDLSPAARHDLVTAWDSMKPWPEAASVVAAIKARGYAIAALSNGDTDMLESLVAIFETPFDHVLSCQQAGFYKPHPAVYDLPTAVLGIPRDQVLHVAGGAMDVVGAVAAGVPCYWSNRHGDRVIDPAYPADFEDASLQGLLGILA